MTRREAEGQSTARQALLAAAISLALSLAGCVTSGDMASQSSPEARPIVGGLPKEAPRTIAPPTVAEREHERLIAAYGGAFRSPETERFLDDLVQRLAAQSDRPDIPYRLTILNSPSVNAFALPSGRLYVTRGLLALANDDAEIAAVIAHEMAHVSAKHAVARADKEKQSALVSIVMKDLLRNPDGGAETQARSQVKMATFSRQQELDADEIGVRTIARAGYDPLRRLAVPVLDEPPDRHPDRPERNPVARQRLRFPQHASLDARAHQPVRSRRHASSARPGTGSRDKVSYLTAIDGLTFGDDPTQGYMRGRAFLHPRLGFTFEVPSGFTIDNTPQAILGVDGSGRALRLDTVEAQGRPVALRLSRLGLDRGGRHRLRLDPLDQRAGGRDGHCQGQRLELQALRNPLWLGRVPADLRREGPVSLGRRALPEDGRELPRDVGGRDAQCAAPQDRRRNGALWRHRRRARRPDGDRRSAAGPLPGPQRPDCRRAAHARRPGEAGG